MDSLDVMSFVSGMISVIVVQILLIVIREKLVWHFKVERGKRAIGEELEYFRNQLSACLTNSTVILSATPLWGVLLAKDEQILSIPPHAEMWRQLNYIFTVLTVKNLNESDKAVLMAQLDSLKQT